MWIFEGNKGVSVRGVFPCRVQGRVSVFSRARMRGSDVPPARRMTLNRSGGSRLTISFAVRFCAFVFASSANDGVNTVIIKVFLVMRFQSPRSFIIAYRASHASLRPLELFVPVASAIPSIHENSVGASLRFYLGWR